MSNLFTANLSQTKQIILDSINNHRVPYITSSPGKGKSAIIKEFAKERNLKLIDVRLSTCLPEDLNGLPFKNNKNKAEYLPFDMFPLETDPIPEGYKGWLLFFDELSGAKMDVQIASYRIMLDREIGQHKIHKKCAIVAAGNNVTDNAGVEEMSTALASRLIHVSFDLTLEEWIFNFAIPNKIDPRIIGFLTYSPQSFNVFNPESTDKTFPCPRTWNMCSDLIKDKPVIKDNQNDYMYYISGSIGDSVATDFFAFTEYYSQLPTLDQIVNDLDIELPSNKPQLQFAFIQYLISNYGHYKNKLVYQDYCTKYKKQFNPNVNPFDQVIKSIDKINNFEIKIIFGRALVQIDNSVMSNSSFMQMQHKNFKGN